MFCMRIISTDLTKHVGKTVQTQGWLHKKRAMGALMFVVLRDRGGLVQIVVQDEKEQAKLQAMQVGTVLTIHGLVKSEPRATGGVEIHDPKILVDVPVEDPPLIEIDKPIDHKSENFDTLFENRAINLRNQTEQSIFTVQASIEKALRNFFETNNFTGFHSPKLLAGATEGGAEVFKLDHFGQEATLAQSPQFYKQMMVGIYERAYEIGPVFRAEPSLTTRHMSEYISVDGEMGFIESFDDVLDLLSRLLNDVVDNVWSEQARELNLLKAVRPKLTKKIPELPMAELHKLFTKATGTDTTREDDPTPAEERWACDYAAENLGSEAIFITEFPWKSKATKFYHYQNQTNPDVAQRADLLFRGVEIVTASQREHRYKQLYEQLIGVGGDPEHPGFRYYLQAFKYGMPAHGGFGLGLERLTQRMLGLSSVKEATLFPRDMTRLSP